MKQLQGVPGLDGHTSKLPGQAGIIIPCRDGGRIRAIRIRADEAKGGRKYTYFSNSQAGGETAPPSSHEPSELRFQGVVRITEGELKAALASDLSAVPTISFPGATQWRCVLDSLERNRIRTVRIAFDSDAQCNIHVADAQLECVEKLRRDYGYAVILETWEGAKGIDDALRMGLAIHEASGDDAVRLARQILKAAQSLSGSSPTTAYKLTDVGNAERFRDSHGTSIKYCWPLRTWFIFDGSRWAPDKTGQSVMLAKQTIRAIYGDMAGIDNEQARDALYAHARRSESAGRLVAMLSLAQSELPILTDQLDQDPNFLNCPNGCVDLRTGELRPHLQSHFITKLCPTGFDPNAQSPVWDAFLLSTFGGSVHISSFIRRLFGYFLTGETREQILALLWGTGSNGKSTMIETFLDVVGEDYTLKSVSSLLLTKKNESHPAERADLFGKRLVICTETGSGRRFDESVVKELTGSDRIRARHLYQDFFEFRPVHKLAILTNHKPIVKDNDHSFWRRMVLIPFNQRFWNPDRGESGPDALRQDKSLPEKLRAEAAGILAWAVRGAVEWHKHGLAIPDEINRETDEYRHSQDRIAQFVAECCEQSTAGICSSTHLWQAYKSWTGDEHMSQRRFSTAIEAMGFVKKRSNGIYFLGIEVASDVPSSLPSEPALELPAGLDHQFTEPDCAPFDNWD